MPDERTVGNLLFNLVHRIKEGRLTMKYQTVGISNMLQHLLVDATLTGHLQASAEEMQEGRMMLSPLQDSMSKNAREVWLLECIPAVADGSMTAEQCWEKVMALAPFGK